ncbi:disease resistance protein RUN1-like [Telopea speciosissima]|uniref:disease resistance protein RUN1-like n=1 Tax=Telopea speciosissima TaxID=54955 RepID=UPI001CC3A66B|nr:disease resistance protein RUN1-like [Telopea speciosissima]
MACASTSSSSTHQWNHDVFLSFIDEDYGDGDDDSGRNFIDQLYEALIQRGYHIFADEDYKRNHDDHITSEFLKTIEESKVSIVVFSKNYGSSIWCLDELVKMLECKHDQMGRHTVLPVFYNVDPSHFRKQNGILEKTFAGYEERFKSEMEKVKSWRKALTEAGNLSGWHLQDVAADDGGETKYIKAIVEEVSMKAKERRMNINTYPVGIDSRIEAINSLLSLDSSDVRIIGIYGIGGVGKTTITKAVYNQILHEFEGSTFLGSVREISEHRNGLIHLQEQLLSDILMKQNIHINNVDRGINVIKQRLCFRKILIVLDDVDQSNQINALVRERDWFGLGSRIIITTRDQHFLNKHDVDGIYDVEKLNSKDSLQLFRRYAFENVRCRRHQNKISKDIVSYLGGVPLALQVFGSFLHKRSTDEWITALQKLKRIPNEEIQEILKLSFDSLDSTEKDIFLDIACFFIGMDKDFAIKILDGCGFFPEIGIAVLTRKSLLIISEKNQLEMHGLIRDMGREIVRKESPNEPGKRSRLWLYEDVYDTLTKNAGTEVVEGVVLNFCQPRKVCLTIEAFTKMERLRMLQANYVQLLGSHEHLLNDLFPSMGKKHLFRELRWLCWHEFPLRYIPTNFHLENLVVLDLQYSSLKKVWKGSKPEYLGKLKILNLDCCLDLTKTPNFLGLPSLEILTLEGCTSLVEVHKSIGELKNHLLILNLKDCTNLRRLPRSIWNLKSLQSLILSGCSQINELPEELGNMESLTELLADGTAIRKLPISIGLLQNLKSLSLGGCKGSPSKSWNSFIWSLGSPRGDDAITSLPASFSGLRSLTRLSLRDCKLSGMLPNDLESLSSLQELDLAFNNFCDLPASISRLPQLQSLWLQNCTKLGSLPELPSSLQYLDANGCTSMEKLSNLASTSLLQRLDLSQNNICSLPADINGLSQLQVLTLRNCTRLQSLPMLPSNIKALDAEGCLVMERLSSLANLKKLKSLSLNSCSKLIEVEGLERLETTPTIHMERCNGLANTFRDNLFQGMIEPGIIDIFVPGGDIPDWFSCQSAGSSIYFEVPPLLNCKIQGLIICVVYAADEEVDVTTAGPEATFINWTGGIDWKYSPKINAISVTNQDHIWLSNIAEARFVDQLEGGDQVDVSIEMGDPIQVKKCGIHLFQGTSSPYDLGVEKGHKEDDGAGCHCCRFNEEQDLDWLTEACPKMNSGEVNQSSFGTSFFRRFLKDI